MKKEELIFNGRRIFMKKCADKNLKTRGQSLVEVLVSLGIFAIVTNAIFSLFFGGQSLSVDSSNAQIATEYASEAMEALRSVRDRNWDELADGRHGLTFQDNEWRFSGAEDSRNIFRRAVFISSLDANTKQASTTVTWQTDPQRPQQITLVERITNFSNPLTGGCGTEPLTGDWTSPRLIGSADIGPGNAGTDVAVALPYVFVSGIASSAAKPDIFVFDAGNPASPRLIDSLNIGSGGINKLFLKDNYLYAVSPNNAKEFIVFDVSNPADISEIAFLNLGGDEDALTIAGFGNAVYVGRKETSGFELTIIDVSVPANPVIAANLEIGDDVNDLFATSQRLYLASEESNNDLLIYDIGNPFAPQQLISYDLPRGGELVSVAYDLRGYIFAGDEHNEFFVLGTDGTGQIYVRDSLITGGSSNDAACQANLVFLGTTNSNKELIIINLSNPDDIKEYASMDLPQISTGAVFVDNKIFMSVRSNEALRIITSAPY